ncbi:TrmH family RNA methyltransferase [Bifidobacterium xylocopae]|uniref:RNA methyltransferase n=1 Tax=Bifidobacterium xylocopae TaxID=2493119 RepID=A0A366KE48_9BIFI|nr:TrmH family RNA methyltransferase [Bifidobacterium xylocopae]RBP99478.1 RNA methyltransferase [Bifidobacterium xylocopae]
MREPNPITKAAMESGEPVFRQVGVGPWAEEHPGEPEPADPRYDPELLDQGDRRNVLDRYRYWTVEAIRADLDQRGRHGFELAVENWTHDFNIGSMVRSANAFGARRVHIVGPHKWNRKGALMTELYQHVDHHPCVGELVAAWKRELAQEAESLQAQALNAGSAAERVRLESAAQAAAAARVIALDIIPGAVPIETYSFPERCLMLFGAEGPGLTRTALDLADDVVYISQFGSVRSINAGAAAAVAMHAWVAQHMSIPGNGD